MTLFRHCVAGALDSQLLHFGLKGGAFHPEDFSSSTFSRNAPAGFLKDP